MDLNYIAKINKFFRKWSGANARFGGFFASHNRFVLDLTRPDGSERTEISFSFCEYLSGPTHWININLVCKEWQSPYDENEIGYEVEDKDAGFFIRGTDTIVVQDNE
jgi:hypothetical protein